jgi:hypothetical protein
MEGIIVMNRKSWPDLSGWLFCNSGKVVDLLAFFDCNAGMNSGSLQIRSDWHERRSSLVVEC